jgi:phosphoglycerate dehydrogenase-like enzyme
LQLGGHLRFKIRYRSLEDLLKESNYISIHTPLNETTRHLLSHKEFETMKQGVYIINTGTYLVYIFYIYITVFQLARGAVINEEALVEALKSGKVRGAGLDVFEVTKLVLTFLK